MVDGINDVSAADVECKKDRACGHKFVFTLKLMYDIVSVENAELETLW